MPARNFIDIAGQRFGKLVVLENVPPRNCRAYWRCRCDCGQLIEIDGKSLRTGNTKTCGCGRGGKMYWTPEEVSGGVFAIPLLGSVYALVDRPDVPLLLAYNWQVLRVKGRPAYAASRVAGVYVLMHRLIVEAPAGSEVDHVDGNGLNNRRENLRCCTHQQNCRNSRKHPGRSDYKGVCWEKRRGHWVAMIRTSQGRKHLGSFDSEKDAAEAYKLAARQYHGEFARTS